MQQVLQVVCQYVGYVTYGNLMQAMSSAVNVLQAILNSSVTPMGSAFEAAGYLEQLKKLNVPAAANVKSFEDFINVQIKTIIDKLEGLQKKCSKERASIVQEAKGMYKITGPGDGHKRMIEDLQEEPEIICIHKLVSEFFEWINSFWELVRFHNQSALFTDSEGVMGDSVDRVFQHFSDLVASKILDVCSIVPYNEFLDIYIVIQLLVDCCKDMDETLSTVMMPLLKRMISSICEQLIEASEKHLERMIKENLILHGKHPETFNPIHGVARFHQLGNSAMHFIRNLSIEAAMLGIRIPSGSRPSFNILKVMSSGSSQALIKLASRKPVLSADGDEVDEIILLHAWKVLENIKTSTLPLLVTTWDSLLQISSTSDENTEAFKWCCANIEDSQEHLVKSWVEIKLEKLEPKMASLLNVIFHSSFFRRQLTKQT